MNSAQALRAPTVPSAGRRMLNKVPEITVYFWVIKVLCTTVGRPSPTTSTKTSASASPAPVT